MQKIIIVGAGLSGATIARMFADGGDTVTVIDKRETIGGNVYDYVDKNDIRVQMYGPHIFHTDKEQEQCRRDELGKYVLISKSFVYFGNKAETSTIDKKYFDILPKCQETKAYSDGQNGFSTALDLIDEFWKDRITVASENPTQKSTQSCKSSTQKTVRKDC